MTAAAPVFRFLLTAALAAAGWGAAAWHHGQAESGGVAASATGGRSLALPSAPGKTASGPALDVKFPNPATATAAEIQQWLDASCAMAASQDSARADQFLADLLEHAFSLTEQAVAEWERVWEDDALSAAADGSAKKWELRRDMEGVNPKLALLFAKAVRADPGRMLAVARCLPVGGARNRMLAAVLERWAVMQPEAVMEHLASLPAEQSKGAQSWLNEVLIKVLGKQSPALAAGVFLGIKNQEARRRMVWELAEACADDPAEGLRMLKSLGEPEFSQLEEQMLRSASPAGAAAWLRANPGAATDPGQGMAWILACLSLAESDPQGALDRLAFVPEEILWEGSRDAEMVFDPALVAAAAAGLSDAAQRAIVNWTRRDGRSGVELWHSIHALPPCVYRDALMTEALSNLGERIGEGIGEGIGERNDWLATLPSADQVRYSAELSKVPLPQLAGALLETGTFSRAEWMQKLRFTGTDHRSEDYLGDTIEWASRQTDPALRDAALTVLAEGSASELVAPEREERVLRGISDPALHRRATRAIALARAGIQ